MCVCPCLIRARSIPFHSPRQSSRVFKWPEVARARAPSKKMKHNLTRETGARVFESISREQSKFVFQHHLGCLGPGPGCMCGRVQPLDNSSRDSVIIIVVVAIIVITEMNSHSALNSFFVHLLCSRATRQGHWGQAVHAKWFRLANRG